MKRSLFTAIVGATLMVGVSAPAKANQLTYYVTVLQIQNAFTSSTFTGNCADLTVCGIYGIGVVSDTLGAGHLVATSSFGVASTAPGFGQADAWVTHTLNSGANPGFEAQGTPDTSIAFITKDANLLATGTPYDANTGLTALNAAANSSALSTSGIGMLSAGTTLGFTLDYGSTVVPVGVDTITFEVLGVVFQTSAGNVGKEGTKSLLGTLTVTSTAAPEPTSIALVFGGIAAIAVSRQRRRRQ